MVIELVLFAQESWRAGVRLEPPADRAVAALTRELLPSRNVTIQIWNEFDNRTLDHVKTVRSVDPKRLVTSSPEAPASWANAPTRMRSTTSRPIPRARMPAATGKSLRGSWLICWRATASRWLTTNPPATALRTSADPAHPPIRLTI
jgi:hypothetical protein